MPAALRLSGSFSHLSFRPDSDLVAGRYLRACVGVRVACPYRVSTANTGSQGLQVRVEAGLPAQAMAAPSEGCCSGELREGQHIRYPLRRCFHKVRVTPAPLSNPPFPSLVFWLLSSLGYGYSDALIIECIRTRTEELLEHGCPRHRGHSNKNVIMVWAWMLW